MIMTSSNQKPVVFFLGDVALDEYYRAPYWPKIKEKVLVQPMPFAPGGMIANAACMAAALGVEAHFLGALNSGLITERLVQDLQMQGIDTQWIVYDDALPDAKTIIILTEDEHTVFIPTMGIQRIEISQKTLAFIEDADYLYTNLAEFKPVSFADRGALALLKQIRGAGCKVVFDMDVDPLAGEEKDYLAEIDILFMNETGFARMRRNHSEEECIREIFHNGVEILVVTKSDEGCDVYAHGMKWHVPGIPVKVIDVTGAGDTFAGSFIYAYHKWQNPYHAAVFATAAAARSVSAMGARSGVGNEQDILNFMEKHGIEWRSL
jgi:sugar/nucleoside kinase (ribokinase family)